VSMAKVEIPRALLERARKKDRRCADTLMETFLTSDMPRDVLIAGLERIAGE